VSWHQKGKTNLDLLEQETVSGSGFSAALQLGRMQICTLTQTHNHASGQHPITQFFTGRMPFLPPS